jgi:hypothetical protein
MDSSTCLAIDALDHLPPAQAKVFKKRLWKMWRRLEPAIGPREDEDNDGGDSVDGSFFRVMG